jgi:hypothetical protein
MPDECGELVRQLALDPLDAERVLAVPVDVALDRYLGRSPLTRICEATVAEPIAGGPGFVSGRAPAISTRLTATQCPVLQLRSHPVCAGNPVKVCELMPDVQQFLGCLRSIELRQPERPKMVEDAQAQRVTPRARPFNTKDDGCGPGFVYAGSEPALVVNVIEIWMKQNFRSVPRNAGELGLVTIAAGRD